jgi:stage II sporulation protein D
MIAAFADYLFKTEVQSRLLLLWRGNCRWLSACLWLSLVAPAQATLDLRVAIQEGASQIRVGSSTTAVVRDASGRPLGQLAAMNTFYARAAGGSVGLSRWQGSRLWIEPNQNGYVFIDDRWYRGKTLVASTSTGITAVNYVDLDQYLYSVVGSEMGGNWPAEALKAQAVAARSFALYKRKSAANRLFDVVDTVSSQAYKGLGQETANTQVAVKATADQVLTYSGQIIQAVFHSSSGGHTENVEDVWTKFLPYLRGVPDYDQTSPVFRWVSNFSRTEISQRLGVGRVLSITPDRMTQTGRPITLKIVSDRGTRVMDADEFRRALKLKSSWVSVTPLHSPVASIGNVGAPLNFQVEGRGFGHGLGMSQWGAYNLAQKGYKYEQILAYYYTGSKLAEIDVR